MNEKPDIVELLESYGVDVRGTAGWVPVKCPFHGDRTASAAVNPQYQKFHCHGCEVHGDAYDLIMAYENCDFREAKEIGESFGKARPNGNQSVRYKTSANSTPLGRRGRR